MGNVVPMDSKLLSNYWYMSWPSWSTHISKLCSHKNQGSKFFVGFSQSLRHFEDDSVYFFIKV